MLSNLTYEKNMSLEQIFENIQIIYSGCLHELIRQISIQCMERGKLMQKIWGSYVSLFERLLMEQKQITNELEKNYLLETSRIHKIYQKEIELLKNRLTLLNDENFHNKTSFEMIAEKYKKLKIKHKKTMNENSSQKTNFENLRTEFNLIQQENMDLKIVIENLSKIKEIDKSDLIIRKLPDRTKRLGSFIQKYDENLEKEDNASNNEKENIEEESLEIIFEEKCVDTKDLMVLITRNKETETDFNPIRNSKTSIIQENKIVNEFRFEIPNSETKEISTQTTNSEFDITPLVKKISVFGKKKLKETEAKSNNEENNSLQTESHDFQLEFQEFLDDIDDNLKGEENFVKKNIKFIEMLNEKCIGNLVNDSSTPQNLKTHLIDFRDNISKTTQSLHEKVNVIIEENQDQKIEIIEQGNDIENRDEEIKRKDEEIIHLKIQVSQFFIILVKFKFSVFSIITSKES